MNDNKNKSVELLENIKSTFNHEFKTELDLIDIVETIYQIDRYQLLEDLAFCAKYSRGLFSISQRVGVSLTEEYINKLQNDLKESVEKFKDLLNEIIKNFSKGKKDSFYLRYLAMNQSAFSNLYNMIEDFEIIKLYLNSLKK